MTIELGKKYLELFIRFKQDVLFDDIRHFKILQSRSTSLEFVELLPMLHFMTRDETGH